MSILLEGVRLSFPHLFAKHAFKATDKPKFSSMFIVDKDNVCLATLKADIKQCMMDKWGKKPNGLKIGLRDGSEKDEMDGFDGTVMFFNASTEKRPGVYDSDRSVLTDEDSRPYAGCYVNARVTPWAQDNEFGKRINFELNGVQFDSDGEAFGGGGAPASAEDFPELEPDNAASGTEASAVDAGDDFLD